LKLARTRYVKLAFWYVVITVYLINYSKTHDSRMLNIFARIIKNLQPTSEIMWSHSMAFTVIRGHLRSFEGQLTQVKSHKSITPALVTRTKWKLTWKEKCSEWYAKYSGAHGGNPFIVWRHNWLISYDIITIDNSTQICNIHNESHRIEYHEIGYKSCLSHTLWVCH
jgi:hypothetical protein